MPNGGRPTVSRPLIGIAVDAAMGHGRAILRGAMRYANVRHSWLIHRELRVNGRELADWPACAGALVAAANCPLVDQLLRSCPHVVSCSGGADPNLMPVVRSDDIAVGRMAAEHLMECRLDHFGFFGPASPMVVADDRCAGLELALADQGFTALRCPAYWPESYAWTDRHHWAQLIAWLRDVPKPIGVMAHDDACAHDLAAACLEAGLGVPDQVAIVGVNNDDLLCESAWPPLSSVMTEPVRIGHEAARVLDGLLGGRQLTGDARVTRVAPMGVARRASTDVLAVDQQEVAAAVRFIRGHACDPCTVTELLRHVPVNRRWLERQFAQHLGRSPLEEMIRTRVDTARQLLLQTDARLTEVAERCGFGTTQTFARQFLAVVGQTPATWRRDSRKASG